MRQYSNFPFGQVKIQTIEISSLFGCYGVEGNSISRRIRCCPPVPCDVEQSCFFYTYLARKNFHRLLMLTLCKSIKFATAEMIGKYAVSV